jgi:hypothetical protein
VQLIRGIFSFMIKRILYIIAIVFIVLPIPMNLRAQQPSLFRVKRMSFNLVGFSEISPVIVKDGILFCSDRRFSSLKDRTAFDGSRLYNIYRAERIDTSSWTEPVELKSDRSTLFNNGPLCFTPDGKSVYFTSEVETGKAANKRKFKNHNGIFIADISGSDLTSIRPFKFNNPLYDVGQPSISRDGKYLFFASDMPEGQGGSDLYYCELINGEWSNPVNMGPKVNSSSGENYPYMHPSERLYFTSNRPGGLGKLDVYYTVLTNGEWEKPTHMPEPINSKSDDFAFVATDNLQTGYFTSNRSNNDDIYEFKSTIVRMVSCDTLVENSYCYRFVEENAVKFDTLPFRYDWKFGDGTSESGVIVEHCYKDPGKYIVQLDIVNLLTKEVLRNQKSDTLIITEIEQPYISSPDKVNAGQNIVLSADSTNLSGWSISKYYWNFGDETVALGKNVPKTFVKAGTYNIQLIVSTKPEQGSPTKEACISKNIIVLAKP